GLQRRAIELKMDPQTLQRLYTQKRFLARLALTDYYKQLILKGSLLVLAHGAPLTRPTQIMAYTLESGIAEKFQAMVHLGGFNSRMKDFYDLGL
ncbi:MAG: nucleotidyl transferase AbiEii/AbiGii toxin family protein, partial [Fibrobacteria bacterium]|nr:nucleotidyl transferase AbiEii/AbiGii toxin family protein [Fibrobacteria bacterium]